MLLVLTLILILVLALILALCRRLELMCVRPDHTQPSDFMAAWKSRASVKPRDDYGTYSDGRRTRNPALSRYQ